MPAKLSHPFLPLAPLNFYVAGKRKLHERRSHFLHIPFRTLEFSCVRRRGNNETRTDHEPLFCGLLGLLCSLCGRFGYTSIYCFHHSLRHYSTELILVLATDGFLVLLLLRLVLLLLADHL